MPNDSSAVANSSNRSRLMLRKNALHPDQIRLGPRRPDAQLADELEREAEGRQDEGARQVGPVRSQTGEGERLGLLELGGVDLQCALGEQEHAELLEHLEVRLQGGDAPELRGGAERVAHVEHELAGGGAHGAELDDLELAAEGQIEHLARGVDLQSGLGLHLHQRFLDEPGGLQRDAAGQLDEEHLGGTDDLDLLGPRGPGVALGVRPGARDELNGQRPGVELPVERIAKGDVVDLEDLGVEDQVLAVGARERELVAVDRLRVDASLVGRIERDVDPRPALERSGRRRRGGAGRLRVDLLLLHRVAGDVLPAPRDEGQRHGRVAELAAEEITVGVGEVAAGVTQPLLDETARQALYQATKGILRKVNKLVLTALRLAATRKTSTVDEAILLDATSEALL